MSRWKAAGIHLLISLIVAILVGSLIYFVWYPPPYFQVAGGSNLMLIIMGVDVVIGPFLTLAVFKAGKKGMHFDLIVIALLQIAAFGYGVHIIAAARPVFIVAEVDRFVVVTANALDDADLAAGSQPEFRRRSWFGPRLVGAEPPQQGSDAFDMAMSGLAGKDIDLFPKYYVPYSQVSEALLTRSRPLTDTMKKSAQDAHLVQQFLAGRNADAADYRSLPLHGRVADFTMVVSAKTRQPVTALAIDPW